MLKPEKISERHYETYKIVRQKSRNRLVQFWQFLHGNMYLVCLGLILSPASVLTSLKYKHMLNERDKHSSLYLSLLFIVFSENMAFWCRGRKAAEDLSFQLVETAQLLEKYSSKEQLRKMIKTTRTARLVASAYAFNLFGVLILYILEPFQHGNLAAPMPYLPDGPFFFWGMYCVQSVIYTAASVGFYSQMSYMSEVCLCITSLFEVLSELFVKIKCRRSFRVLMPVHQSLLEISHSLMILFRFTWFIILVVQVSLLICNTYFVISGDSTALMVVLIITIWSFLYPSFLFSENMSKSSEMMWHAAYENEWVLKSVDARKDLSLVVLRSHKPVYMTATLFGRLGFAKYMSVVDKWYTVVQALLNFKL